MRALAEFADTVQMELAIKDIRRYQRAYLACNGVNNVVVRWTKGWYAIGRFESARFVRPTMFRNMADTLEARLLKRQEAEK